jgi:hypothetical protein
MRLPASLLLLILIPACGSDSGGGTPPPGDLPPTELGDSPSIATSEPPVVRIVSPGPRTQCPPGATITIHAVAIDPDAEIVRVDFFDGTALIGTQWAAPFKVAWGGIAEGTHVLTAVALDVQGLTAVSSPVTVVATDGDDDEGDDDDRDGHGPRRRHR